MTTFTKEDHDGRLKDCLEHHVYDNDKHNQDVILNRRLHKEIIRESLNLFSPYKQTSGEYAIPHDSFLSMRNGYVQSMLNVCESLTQELSEGDKGELIWLFRSFMQYDMGITNKDTLEYDELISRKETMQDIRKMLKHCLYLVDRNLNIVYDIVKVDFENNTVLVSWDNGFSRYSIEWIHDNKDLDFIYLTYGDFNLAKKDILNKNISESIKPYTQSFV